MKQNLFSHWINLQAPYYSIIKKRLNIWDKDLKLNYALAQGILYLEKSYCQLNNCGNCPLFMHC